MLTKTIFIITFALLLFLISCSGKDAGDDFQVNTPMEFVITDVFDGYGTLEKAWNSIDPKGVDTRLKREVNGNIDDFISFSSSISDIMFDDELVMPKLLGEDTKNIIELLNDTQIRYEVDEKTDSFYGKSGEEYKQYFYSFLNETAEENSIIESSHPNLIFHNILARLTETNTPEEIYGDIQDLIDDIKDDDFQSDFIDISKTIAKLLIQSDKPMWINNTDENILSYAEIDPDNADHKDLKIGNTVKGEHDLIMWFNHMMIDPEHRESLHDIIRELADTYDPSNGYDNPSKLRKFLCDLEDHFTKGGAVYETDPIYHQENEEVHSNAELSEVIREIFPYLQQIVVRSDRPNSLISDLYNDEVYPLKTMVKYLKKIGWNPDDASLEQSFYNLMRHDIFGRDRVTDPEAYHISYLEHLLFFCSVAVNVGYKDGGLTGEIKNITHPNFSHGHGDNWGLMTVNDSMYAISTKKTFGLLGMYDLSFKDKDKNHLFRSRHPFTIENKDDHQFYVDQNYSIGRFTAGTTGDLGSPRNGGFNPKDENGEPIKNAYRPFCANGLEEDDVAVNTIVSSMHMTMNDQGPYYYAPPDPETIVLADGKTYSIYYMLTGEADIGSSDPNDPCHEAVEEVYAYVHKPADGSDNWEYVYAEDPCDNDPEYGDHVFLVGKLKEKKTHALFLSQEDLSDGVDIGILRTLRIQMGDPENPDVNVVVSFPFGTYYQQDVVRVINSAVGETVCYPYDVGEKRYIQVKSSYGPITLKNVFFNPIDELLVAGTKQSETVEVAINAFPVTDDTAAVIQIDDSPEKVVYFNAPHLKLWSLDKVSQTLVNSDIGEHVTPYRKGFIIKGTSNNPDVAKVKITNVPGNATNCVETFFGGNGDIKMGFLERVERFKSTYQSNFYMARLATTPESYTSMGYNKKGNMELKRIGADGQAKAFVVEENISETDSRRACATAEEALFRNYQWFFAERKFVLSAPVHASLGDIEVGIVYMIFETNGYTGFMNVRKYRDNHTWAKKASDGESDIPGDFRVELVADINSDDGLLESLLGVLFTEEMVYNDVLGCGAAFTAIMASYSPGIYRLGFPVAPEIHHGYDANGDPIIDYLVSSQDFQVGDEIWNNRNALLPVIETLLSGIHKYTQVGYETKEPGFNQPPNSPPSLKSGYKQVLNMVTPLLRPLMYYQKDKGDYPHKCYKPRLVDDHEFLKSSADFYNIFNPMEKWYGSDYERRYFLPQMKKTLVNIMIDSDMTQAQTRCDGVLPEIRDTKILTNLFKVLMSDENDAVDFPEALEQVLSGIKLTKAEFSRINEGELSEDSQYQDAGSYKRIKFPNWMFAQGIESSRDVYGMFTEFTGVRDEDFILDEVLDGIIGHDYVNDVHDGYGLAEYPDDKIYDEDWEDFNNAVTRLAVLLHKDGPYSITQDLLDLIDLLFAKERPYSSDEISGLLYTLGKFFAYYDNDENRWIYQGYDTETFGVEFNDLYNIIRYRLVRIHDIVTGISFTRYDAMLTILANLFEQDGVVEFIIDTVSVDAKWEEVIYDLYRFTLGECEVCETALANGENHPLCPPVGPDSPLWPTLAELLNDVAIVVENSNGGEALDGIYENYGFQAN